MVQWNILSETQHADVLVERLFQKFQSDTIQLKNDTVFQSKCEKLKENLAELGYFDALLTHQKKGYSYTTNVKLNSKIETIYIQHPDIQYYSVPTYATRKDIDILILPIEKSKDYLNILTEYFQNTGYPFVKIKLIHLLKKENQITAQLKIDKGKLQQIDQIIVKGYEQFPKNFLKYKLQITENQVFNKSQIQNLSSLLQSLPFVTEIRKPEILFTKDTTYLYLYLEKEKSNSIDGIIGFSNAETGNGLRLNGHLDLILHNAFNKGENLELKWISDGQKSQSLQTEIDFPFIFNTPFLFNYTMEMYKRDSTFFNIKNQLNIGYLIKQNHRLGFEWNHHASRTITTSTNPNLSDFSVSFYGATYAYTLPGNSKLFPFKITYNNKFLNGKREQEKQFIIDSQITYNLGISTRHYISLENQTALLISKNLLENELFRLGGNQTFRGFPEKSLTAQKYSLMKTGYHYLTSESSYISMMSDWGFLQNTQTDFIYNFGLGYKMGTGFGDFYIQYFIGKTPQSSFSLNHSFLYVNFTQRF